MNIHEARERAYAVKSWADVADQAAPVLRWASNGNEPFDDLLAIWQEEGFISAAQRAATNAARAESTAAFLAAYRANPPRRSAEELAEIRAEFGDEPVIDVITGERIQ